MMSIHGYNDKGEPERVYIQNWGSGEATWCTDQIMDETDDCPDIEYVHVNEYNKVVAALESYEGPR